jgi:hypothetical protein
MHTTVQRWGRGLAALIALAALCACSLGREPAYDAALAGEVTALTAGTLRLFQDLTPGAAKTYADREPRYRDLTGRAETVRLMAQARGSAVAPRGLALRLATLGARLPQAADIAPQAGERLADYAEATPAYMEDYLRNLTVLEDHDRAATGGRAERVAAYQAALAAHETDMQAYLDAFRQWQAGRGPHPDQPAAPPQAPALGLDPVLVALRRTVLEDILRDALVYERDILNRNR